MAKQQSTPAPEPVIETAEQTAERIARSASVAKGRPTPSRAEREAQNKRPLVPSDRKEATRQAKTQQAEARRRAQAGMAAGDDKYLPARERGPQRKFVRDFVDARFNIGEFMIPVMFLVILLTFIPVPEIQVYGMLTLWVFFIIAILDCVFLGFRVRKALAAKFGEAERGVRWYAAMRALQLRPLRLPKPQVKRGQFPK
ncbi:MULTISPECIES: DUF3043 domain-containing protein [unclassified Plantibacter]|uniref:DUF3043 domain-containing protein n=1 Tax=unclassified Plantibacter TaxID=2624265 RepID=UPI003D353030